MDKLFTSVYFADSDEELPWLLGPFEAAWLWDYRVNGSLRSDADLADDNHPVLSVSYSVYPSTVLVKDIPMRRENEKLLSKYSVQKTCKIIFNSSMVQAKNP